MGNLDALSHPLVSILVITYNQENYITQTVESLVNQKCNFGYEILIGEDCSTDSTREVCIGLQNKYPDKIRLLLNDANKGVLANFYDSFFACRGKYIAECAGDDFWIDDCKLQKQVDVLESDPEVVLVHTNWKILIEHTGQIIGNVRARKPYFHEAKIGKEYTGVLLNQFNGPFVLTVTACYRKAAVEAAYGRYPSLFTDKRFLCEDYQLVFVLLQSGSFYYLPDETLVYRQAGNSVSQSHEVVKAFHFNYSMLLLRLEVIRQFDLEVKDAADYLTFISDCLFLFAFKAKRRDLSMQAYELYQSVGFPLASRNRLLHFITMHFALHLLHPFFRLARTAKLRFKQLLLE